jgi:MFS family permease
VAEPGRRGALGSLAQLLLTAGILAVTLACPAGHHHWRLVTLCCAAPPALLALCLAPLPSSPAFLASRGREDDARRALQWLRGAAWPGLEVELTGVLEEVAARPPRVGPLGLFRNAEHRRPFCISLALMALVQLSGIDYIIPYSTVIFESSGSSLDSCLGTALIGGVMVLGTIVTIFTIDRFGRKVLLIISSSFVSVSLLSVGLFFQLQETCPPACDLAERLSWVPLVALGLFILAFSVGLGPVPWVLNVELMPAESMAAASSLCTGFSWLVSYGVAALVPVLGAAVRPSTAYFLFAAITAAGVGLVAAAVPETRGRSMEQIQQLLAGPRGEDLARGGPGADSNLK